MPDRSPFASRDELALGAFLHDIGKLAQRAFGSNAHLEAHAPQVYARASDVLPSFQGHATHWHALWTDWVFDTLIDPAPFPAGLDRRWVRDCAVYHHKPLQDGAAVPHGSLTWLIAEADRIASGIERKPRDEASDGEAGGGRDAYRTTPLRSPFSLVRIDERRPVPADLHQPLRELSADGLDPAPGGRDPGLPQIYAELWPRFADAYRDLAGRVGDDVPAFHDGLISLSERFLWAVPSSTVDDPDVGLHDHARAVAAVAAALHAHHEARGDLADERAIRDRARPKLRFLVGDLSGIQAALFRLASEGARGLARVLRGRSLRIQLIAEAVARQGLATFAMPAYNLLQSAGGRFLILLPATDEDEQRADLDGLRADVDCWMRRQYEGDLVLNLALTAPFPAAAMLAPDGVQRVLDLVGAAAEEAKQHPLAGAREPVSATAWVPELGVCSTCGVRPAAPHGGLDALPRCAACHAETAIGRAYPKAAAIILEQRGIPDALDDIVGVKVALPAAAYPHRPARGYRLRGRPDAANLPAADRFAGAFVPRHDAETLARADLRAAREGEDDAEEDDLLTFAELAVLSQTPRQGRLRGRPMLAALKADVDRLGQIFSRGLGARRSLARTAALSRTMDAFFTGFLPHRLERSFPRIYTVYAGGDDLLLLGPWLDVLRLAERLRADFSAFVGGSEQVTLSAGVALFDARTPVPRAAEEAEERLALAKDGGRDRIHAVLPLDSAAVGWSDYAEALARAEELDRLVNDEASGVTTALLYKLLHFDDRRQACKAGDVNAADWMAKLGYHLWRALPPGGSAGPRHEKTREFLLGLMGLSPNLAPRNGERAGAPARLALSIAIYRNR